MVVFAASIALSVAVLLVFVGWTIFDASFKYVLELVGIGLRIRQHPGVRLRDDLRWNNLGSRLALFCLLVIIAFAALLGLCWSALVTDAIFAALMSLVVILGAWMLTLCSYGRIQYLGIVWRLKRALPRFQSAAVQLANHWPTESGVLAGLGAFRVGSEDSTDVLTLDCDYDPYSRREQPGCFVTKLFTGGLRFDLAPIPELKLEYHPRGGAPASFVDTLPGFPVEYNLQGIARLEDEWYFVWYDITWEELEAQMSANPA